MLHPGVVIGLPVFEAAVAGEADDLIAIACVKKFCILIPGGVVVSSPPTELWVVRLNPAGVPMYWVVVF
jgi:hypothetical protein